MSAATAVEPIELSRPRRRLRWLLGAALVAILIVVTAGLMTALVTSNQADDPRSVQSTRTAALASLLTDQGVRVLPTTDLRRAAELGSPDSTLVVANADRLSEADARRLGSVGYGRLILLRPTTVALRSFGVAASTAAATDGVFGPACAERAAVQAGSILLEDARSAYRFDASPLLACYRFGAGSAYLRTAGAGGPVDLGSLVRSTVSAAAVTRSSISTIRA